MTLVLNQIILGDCLEVMKQIPDKSIDLVLTDPPYGTTACEWDKVVSFDELWKEIKRVTRNESSIMTASQPFTTDLINSNRKNFKYELIWEKEQGTNQFMKDIMPLKIHENILIFAKEKMDYLPQKEKSNRIINKRKGVLDKITNSDLKDYYYDNKGLNYPTSILFAKRELSANTRFHPTQKPVSLWKYLIKTYSKEGQTILDPFAGSGTTAIACHELKRNFICIEKEPAYVEISQKRLEEAKMQLNLF